MSFGLTSTFVVNEGQPAAWVGNFADLPALKIKGRILYTLDTNAIYLDISNTTRTLLSLPPYGANNGLSLSQNANTYNVRLGGTLIQTTDIVTNEQPLTIDSVGVATIETTSGIPVPNAVILLTDKSNNTQYKLSAEAL